MLKEEMKYLSDIDFYGIPEQVKTCVILLLDTPRFIVEHKLWKGYFSNIWVFAISVIAAFLFSQALFADVKEMVTHEKENQVKEQNAQAEEQIARLQSMIASTEADSLIAQYEDQIENLEAGVEQRLKAFDQPLISGFLKFVLLLILEIVIYHFSVQTNNILKFQNEIIKYDDFVRAEIRMIKVMVRSAIATWLIWLLLRIVFGIFGLTFLHESVLYLVTAFYLGVAFFDNYMEQLDVDISASTIVCRIHLGAVLVIGLLSSVLIVVPLVGPLIVPVVCSIAATRYAHHFQLEHQVPTASATV